jgi:pycsar effector protein
MPPRTEALRQDLSVGLHTVTEFNQSIRYADTKAGALAAVQALAVTVLAARRDSASADRLAIILFGVCLLGVLTSAALLAVGQTPRLIAGARPSRISFPSLAGMTPDDVTAPPSLAAQHEQIWRQAASLAAIAMTKYRWLHRAMVSTLLTLAVVLLWLALTTWFTRA